MYEVCRDSVDGASTELRSTTDKLEDGIEIAKGGAHNFGRRWVVIDTETDRVVWESEKVSA